MNFYFDKMSLDVFTGCFWMFLKSTTKTNKKKNKQEEEQTRRRTNKMADDFSVANSLFVDEEFEEALVHYNKAIESEKEKADYYVKRSFCHYKLKNFTEAVGDATVAISLNSSSAIAHQRKGMACFALEEYEAAKEAFQSAEKLNSTAQIKTWIRKCDAELEDEDDEEEEEAPAPTPTPTPTPAATSAPPSAPVTTVKKYRHDWYQSDKKITLEIFIKKIKKEQADIDVQENELCVSVKLSEHEEYQLNLDLFGAVVVENTKIEFLSTKIVISLEKKTAGSWADLEKVTVPADVKSIETETNDSDKTPAFQKKNWDAILADEPEDKLEGDAALNKVFQDIFANGSDEQKKAMVKSFTESGGTVLSTNWQDVGKREVKGSPPKGLEMKSWKETELGK